jgi:hypothetical protein
MSVVHANQDAAARWLLERRDLAERRESIGLIVLIVTRGATEDRRERPSRLSSSKEGMKPALPRRPNLRTRRPIPKATSAAGPTHRAGLSARTGQDTWLTGLLERASREEDEDFHDFAPKRA